MLAGVDPRAPRPPSGVLTVRRLGGRQRRGRVAVTAAWHPDAVLEPRFRWSFPTRRIDPRPRRGRARPWAWPSGSSALLARGASCGETTYRVVRRAAAGLHDPALLPDAERLHEHVSPRARDGRERVMVFGDFDADGLDRARDPALAFRRLGIDVQPYVPRRLEEGHGLSLRRVDTRAPTASDHRHGRLRARAGSRDRGGGCARRRRHRHGPPPGPGRAPAGLCGRQPASRRMRSIPIRGSREAALLSSSRSCSCSATCRVDLADLAASARSPMSRPIVGENRAIARLGLERAARSARGPASRRCSSGRGSRRRPGPRYDRVRPRATAQCRRSGRGGAPSRPPPALRDPEEAAQHADALETANRRGAT